jgi:Golgi phosphoprotein 3 (GPP34)
VRDDGVGTGEGPATEPGKDDAGRGRAVDLTDGVAVRLSAFCLEDGSGRLRRYDLWDVAVRGALLVDLALAGRVSPQEGSVVVDATPTVFAPADQLLAPMAVEPGLPLDRWMERGSVDLADLVRDNVRSGRWAARWTVLGRRYTVLGQDPRTERLPHRPGDDGTPALAALAAIGAASGIPDLSPGEPAEELLERTGPVRWLCEAVVDRLRAAHLRNRWLAGPAIGPEFPGF